MSDTRSDLVDRSATANPSSNTLHFHGPALCSIREETGVSRKTLAERLVLPWQLIAVWEDEHSEHCPSSDQLMALCNRRFWAFLPLHGRRRRRRK